MADKRITDLTPITAADLDPAVDVLALADVSSAETKKLTVADAIASSAGSLPPNSINGDVIVDGSITSGKLTPDSVTFVELADNAVDTPALQDKSVTQPKLADGAVGTDQLIDGAVTADKIADGALGQASIQDRSIEAIKLVQNTLTAEEIAPNAITGSELADGAVDTPAIQDNGVTSPKLADGSVATDKIGDRQVTQAKLADNSVGTNQLIDGSVTENKLSGGISLDKLPDAPANTVLAGSNGGSTGPAAFRSLVGPDLPLATDSSNGAVNVPASGGLTVSGAGSVGIGNSVAPGTNPVVTYDSHGLITGGRALQNSDLPPPAAGEPGVVKAGDGITIAGDGTISQSLTGVTAGTYPKVTVDVRGNVTNGGPLESSDLPALDLNSLTGQLTEGQLADKSVTRPKLANYAISFIQEARPNVDASVHIGCFWFQESTATLHQWNGNSWLSVGQGRLSSENLRYCGTVNATTGKVDGLTQFGVGEGIKIGDDLPVPADDITGIYFVISTAGGAIAQPQVNGVDFDAGDWVICNGEVNGYVRIDTASGGAGGGGATNLNDLLDVNVGSATEGALLQLMANGTWQDVYAIDAGEY